jgi:hypothetical protein
MEKQCPSNTFNAIYSKLKLLLVDDGTWYHCYESEREKKNLALGGNVFSSP